MSADELAVDVPATIPDDAVERLRHGVIDVLGRMPNASNATFLARISEPDGLAIYKPGRGERPLWDFAPGLYRREAAAYELSAALGWHVVPPTVIRDDAPLGAGSLQWFVNADFRQHYFSLHEEGPQLDDQFRAIAAFDIVANNTDRKSGHCLLEARPDDAGGPRVWAIDNGLCFSMHAALRTVIWDFADEPLPADVVTGLRRLVDESQLVDELVATMLDADERAAIPARAAALLAAGRFPSDPTGRGYPWPLV